MLIDDILELIEEIELRLMKAECLYEGLNEADKVYHKEIERNIKSDIKQSEGDMEDLQKELREQSYIKNLKNQYEEVAREINQFESHEVIQTKIAEVESESKTLTEKSNSDEIILKRN